MSRYLLLILIMLLALPLGAFSTVSAAPDAQWTFMVYLDGDNNLEEPATNDFLEMASAGSDANINIVVQFDRIDGYDDSYGDWTTCKRFLITPGMTPDPANAVSDLGEVNMGHLDTLVDFVQWAATNYPATNYALVLWNHGGGWRGAETLEENLIFKDVCVDDTSGDVLYMDEVQTALTTISSPVGTMDLIGFDACLMGMVEVAYEIRDHGSVMAGSEQTEPWNGWPYDTILSDLKSNPSWTATQLGTDIVDRYYQSYGNGETMSAIDLSYMNTLASAINSFAQTMRDSWNTDQATVKTAAQSVMNELDAAIMHEQHGPSCPDSHGLAIYFPATLAEFNSDYNATTIDFPSDTVWEEFLTDYYVSMGGSWIVIARYLSQEYQRDEHIDLYDFCQELVDYSESTFQWTTNGPDGGYINALAIDPQTPSTLYAGTDKRGVFRSTDAGEHWSDVSLPIKTDVNTLAINPDNPAVIYAGTARRCGTLDVGGVYRSDDSGHSWVLLLEVSDTKVLALCVDPHTPSIIYAGVGRERQSPSNGGVYKSTDSGQSWTAVNNGLPPSYLPDGSIMPIQTLAIDPDNPSIIYAGTDGHGDSEGVYKSIDGGANWSFAASGIGISPIDVYALAIDPQTTTTLYLGTWYGVFKSTDGGDNWSDSSDGLPRFRDVNALAIDPSNPDIIYVGMKCTEGVYKSIDAGANWNPANLGLPSSGCNALGIDPSNPTTVYAAVRGVAHKSTDGGASWYEISSGFSNANIYAVAVDPQNPTTVYASVSGIGLFRSLDAGANWERVYSGTVRSIAIDPKTPTTTYATGSGLIKSTDGGENWSRIWYPSTYAIAIDPQNPSTIYVVAYTEMGLYYEYRVYKSVDGGQSWPFWPLKSWSFPITCIAIDPVDPDTLYIGTSSYAYVFKSTDGGQNWVSKGCFSYIWDIEIDPTSTNIVYLADVDEVFMSQDGGETWQGRSQGLPSTDVTALVIDPDNPSVLYAGTFGGGVFRSADYGENWTQINGGLDNLYVQALAIGTSSTSLYAGTYYGGVYTSSPMVITRLAEITASPSQVPLYVGETQQLAITAIYSDESTADVTANATYASDDESVATVSDAGLITAVGEGTATITVSYTEGGITVTTDVSVTVIPGIEVTTLYEGANPIYYTGATMDLPAALTNINEITEIIWQRDASTSGEWWSYLVEWDYGQITQLENGKVYIIVVSEDCDWNIPQEEEEGQPQHGGTLTVNNRGSSNPDSWDLLEGGWGTLGHYAPFSELLFIGDVIERGPRGTNEYSFKVECGTSETFLTGNLAESWDWVDPLTLVFNIHPGIMWAANPHIGFEAREFTAYDAEFTLTRYLDDPVMGATYLAWVDSFEATDRYTLVLHAKRYTAEWVYALQAFGHQYPEESVIAGMTDWRNLVGTGPFILTDFVMDSAVTYERNPNWWKKNQTINGIEYELPFIDRIVAPVIFDESTRIAALRTGKLDIDIYVSPLYEDTLRKTCPELIMEKHIHECAWLLRFQYNYTPFSNRDVRRALIIGTDMEALFEAVYGGGVEGGWPFSPGFGPDLYTPIEDLPAGARELYDYDPPEARQMLDDAGYPDGFPTEIHIYAGAPDQVDFVEMLADMWEAIGIELTIKIHEKPVMDVMTWGTMDFDGIAMVTYGHNNPLETIPFLKVDWLSALGVDEYYLSAADEAVGTVDPVERTAKFKELGIYVVNDASTFGLGSPYWMVTWWPWVKNYYGEIDAGQHYMTPMFAHLWLDLDLQAEMGF